MPAMDLWQALMWLGLLMLGVLGAGAGVRYLGYCWARGKAQATPATGLCDNEDFEGCTLPAGHAGLHDNPASKARWSDPFPYRASWIRNEND